MPPKKVDKTLQLKGREAEDLIERYLIEQYRPFGVNDIVQNLHNRVTKTNATKALETLVSQDRIICKLFGKAAIYCCKEQQLQLPPNVTEEEITIEALEQLREECNALNSDINEWQTQLNQLTRDPTNIELIEQINQRKVELEETKTRLEALEQGWKPQHAEVTSKLVSQNKVLEKAIKKRKKIMQEAVALVLSTQNITGETAKADYLEELGFEPLTPIR
ncbi:AFR474Wp [Eremothecium gossypii ATCC 10895]|uniref:AFR474Wp n=1 Tax=Eremothecium gossypii (strain ATCC 10895 / CBS 109.51 / FGSC 9923 / NRRL Y-1056) TaxID=284811 RepID=Q752U9_EREGS|nr:AFR474Wp [Eremothecium gossypii ATCC 10895]AAS53845.2 AFR474Wp [Eremothecium gossypii ATCC 10895]